MLDVSNLHVRYGAVEALHDISFRVSAGEIVVLIGANGAGKSSAVNAIAGLVVPLRGAIRLGEAPIETLHPSERVRRGLALVMEGRGIFPDMMVSENLELGGYLSKTSRQAALHEVLELFPRLRERISQVAGTLSGGEQQMLAIGRALMSSPRILLLDEPSLGLAPKVVDEIAIVLQTLARKRNVTILLAEQNSALSLDLADRGYVLQNGKVAFQGTTQELRPSADLIRAYLGLSREEAQ